MRSRSVVITTIEESIFRRCSTQQARPCHLHSIIPATNKPHPFPSFSLLVPPPTHFPANYSDKFFSVQISELGL